MKDYQNKGRLLVFMILLLQRKPTGPHAARGLDMAALGWSTFEAPSRTATRKKWKSVDQFAQSRKWRYGRY